ncbi:hypothetical protein [Hydrogenophaga flava]|uniref:hypothetical protein n=1 Tax=Hydrogenophaga flava TaxID=65657 RepID=UPI0012F74CFC|nr:hypothetical protein [Hydrogenophaga flava]
MAALSVQDFVEQANELLDDEALGVAVEVLGDPGDEGRELIFTAHGDKEKFTVVNTFVSTAPDLQCFSRVIGFRRRTGEPSFEIRMDDMTWSASDYRVGLFKDGGLVGLELLVNRRVPHDMIDASKHAAFIMLDHIIGEYDFAVRVGAVDFVDHLSVDEPWVCSLEDLPRNFDRMWTESLGRTGLWPQKMTWAMLAFPSEVEGEAPLVVSVNRSAGALATRADMAYCLDVVMEVFDKPSLQRAQDVEDLLRQGMESQQASIMVASIMDRTESTRTCRFYLSDPRENKVKLDAICRGSGVEPQITVAFDPSWDGYFEFTD